MTKINAIAVLLLGACVCFSCKKDGDIGPKGEQGQVGQTGATGADGSTILSGMGVPAENLGKNGDYYLDRTDAGLYGPKTATGWGAALLLKGNTGASGKDGSKMLSGAGLPSATLGIEGDFYFDTQNLTIYGPKLVTGWGMAVSLKPTDNGIKTLLYKNQAFQSIVSQEDKYATDQIDRYTKEIADANEAIASYQLQYDNQVAQINANPGYSNTQKAAFIAQAKSNFDNQVSYPKNTIIDANKQLLYYNFVENASYSASSNYTLDAKYQDIYDNGLVIVKIRPSSGIFGWGDQFYFQDPVIKDYVYDITPEINVYKPDEVNSVPNGKIAVAGSSYASPKSKIEALRYDVKVTLIPASSVETIASKGVNTKNFNAVLKYLDAQ